MTYDLHHDMHDVIAAALLRLVVATICSLRQTASIAQDAAADVVLSRSLQCRCPLRYDDPVETACACAVQAEHRLVAVTVEARDRRLPHLEICVHRS